MQHFNLMWQLHLSYIQVMVHLNLALKHDGDVQAQRCRRAKPAAACHMVALSQRWKQVSPASAPNAIPVQIDARAPHGLTLPLTYR